MQSPAAIFLRKRNENFSFKLPVIKSVNFQVDFRSSLNSMCKNILNAKENFKIIAGADTFNEHAFRNIYFLKITVSRIKKSIIPQFFRFMQFFLCLLFFSFSFHSWSTELVDYTLRPRRVSAQMFRQVIV